MSLHNVNHDPNPAGGGHDDTRAGHRPVPVYRSHDLFREGTRVHIEHGAGTYILQITRQGKLILTK